MTPRIRITAPDGTGPSAKVEFISPYGSVTDISSMVSKVTWSCEGGRLAEVQLTIASTALDALGNLTSVLREPEPCDL